MGYVIRGSHYVRSMTWLITLLLVSLLSACGGGGSSGGDSTVVKLKGVAQKGLFTELVVKASPVDKQSGQVDRNVVIEAVTDASDYQLVLPDKGWYLLEATGTFIDETTGESILLSVPMESLVEVDQPSQDSNINLLTHLFSSRVIASMEGGASLEESETAAQQFITQSLGLDPATDFTTLDITAIQANSTLDDPNLQLLLFSSAILQQLPGTGTLTDFGSVIENFIQATDTTAVQSLFSDLAGSGALALYDQAHDYLTLPDLPFLQDSLPVYVCDTVNGCSWEIQTTISASLIGSAQIEADGTASFRVQLSAASSSLVGVSIQSVSKTAIAGSDFVPVQQRILFPPGVTTKKITMPVLLDNQTEVAEYFEIQIVSVTEGYGISNGRINITLTEGLAGSDVNLSTDQVRFDSVCVSAVGDGNAIVPGDCLGNGLVAIPDNENAALTMKLAMAVACEGVTCEPWRRAWAVEFVLEAFSVQTDLRGNPVFTVEGSSTFARHRFPGSHLIRSGEETRSYALYAHIDKGFRDLDQLASANGWHLRIKARLLGIDAVAALDGFRSPLVLPTTLQAGDRSLPFHISSIESGSSQGVCASGEYQLTAEFSLDGSLFQDSTVCAVLDEESNTLTLANGQINIAENKIDLPPFHSTFQRSDVRALATFTYLGSPSAESTLYLHADGLPFAFPVNSTFVDSEGLKIEYDHLLYLQAADFHQHDPRYNGVTSNDIPFQSMRPGYGSLYLTEQGIQTTLSMAQGNGRYAFPEGDMEWGDFELNIVNGKIDEKLFSIPDVKFSLLQNGRCANLHCVESLDETHRVAGTGLVADNQGAMVGIVKVVSGGQSQPRWGAIPNTTDSAFTRPDDLAEASNVVLALPGYLFTEETDQGLDASLYAHLGGIVNPDTGAKIIKYRLGSLEALEGNQWPTGLSVGPQFYADMSANGLPSTGNGRSLNGKPLIINNGVDTPYDLNVNIGAKYVIRNAGITGVFNIAAEELQTPVSFYGYKLYFERFAFRVVDNAMDDFSWIDGNLRIPDIEDTPPPTQNNAGTAGAGGFDLKFVSLLLDCAGGLAGASTIPDPANPQSLYAWHAATDIYDMSFANTSFCSVNPRVLTLDQTLDIKALDRAISMVDVEWRADGSVGRSRVLGYQEFILDGKDDYQGFAISTTQGRLETLLGTELYGVLKLDDAEMTSYAWSAPRVDIRLSNDGQGAAERSVVTTAGQGLIDASDSLKNEQVSLVNNTQYDLDMKYNWGDSRFGFELPVYYSSGDNFTAPRFTGRYKESDLYVLKAGAGIDFIEAGSTHLSFGLSADIKKIQELPLSLDLGDAASLTRMDDFLNQSGLGGDLSLQALLGPIQQKLSVISSIAGSGLKPAIRNHLNSLIADLPGTQVVDITQSLSQLQSLPNQMQALLSNEILSDQTFSLLLNAQELRTQLTNLRETLMSTSSQDESRLVELRLQFEQIRENLQLLKSRSDAALLKLGALMPRVIEIIDQSEPVIQQLKDSLQNLSGNNGIKSVFRVDGEFCVSGELTVDNAGHLTPVVELSSQIDALINDFMIINIASNMSGLSATAGAELQQLLELTEQLTKVQASALQIEWDNGFTVWKDTLCADGSDSYTQPLDDYLIDNQGEVTSILEVAENLAVDLTDLKNSLAPIVMTALSGYDAMSFYIDSAIEFMSLDIDTGLEEVDWDGNRLWLSMNSTYAGSVELLPLGVESLLAETGAEGLDLFSGVFLPVIQNYAEFPDEIRQIVQSSGSFNFPGASFTPDQFRTLLVNKIMDTAAMKDLLAEVQGFTGPLLGDLRDINLNLTDHINAVIKRALSAVNPQVNDLLQQATSALPGIPLTSAGLDGMASFEGRDLSKMHMDASWQMNKDIGGIAGPTFMAALDIVAASADGGSAPCNAQGEDSFDVNIRAKNVSAGLFGDSTTLDYIELGFILAKGDILAYQPVSVYGGLGISEPVEYAGFSMERFNFTAALGLEEVYIGAGGGGSFSDMAMDMSAFFGRTCDDTRVSEIDPQSAHLLPFGTDVPSPFTGLYLRGEVSAPIPVLDFGCALQIGFRGSAGSWITLEPLAQVGGILGGAALGSVACVGSVRGQVNTVGAIDINGKPYFAGEAFVIAGAGADCDRWTWTDVGRSRKDRWCGTGDFKTGVSYENGDWSYVPGLPSVLH